MKISFKTLAFIFFIPLLLLIFPLHSRAEEEVSIQTKGIQESTDNEVEDWKGIISMGVSALSSEPESTARDNAIEDAIRRAVEQAVGTIVSSQSMVSNYTIFKDLIYSKASDYLKSYKILDEYKDDGLYFVKIEAQVDLDSISEVLHKIGLLSMRRQHMEMGSEPESSQEPIVSKKLEAAEKVVAEVKARAAAEAKARAAAVAKARAEGAKRLAAIEERKKEKLREKTGERKAVGVMRSRGIVGGIGNVAERMEKMQVPQVPMQKKEIPTIERLRQATGSVDNSMRDSADKIVKRSMEEIGVEKEKIVTNSKANIASVNMEKSQTKGAISNAPGQTLANVAIGSNRKSNMASVNKENSVDPFMQTERILAKMKEANIAFNTPSSMNLTEKTEIQLVLSLTKQIKELKQLIEAPGEKESARIKVYNSMEARLVSSDFEVNAITPEEQAVTLSGVTEWKWGIKPKSTGIGHLHLTLSAVFTVEGNETRKVISVFDKTIEVEVTGWQTVSTFVKQNWQWLWVTIVVPIAGWLLNRRRKRRNVTTTG